VKWAYYEEKNYWGEGRIVAKLRPKCSKAIDFFGYYSIAEAINFWMVYWEMFFFNKMLSKNFALLFYAGVILSPLILSPTIPKIPWISSYCKLSLSLHSWTKWVAILSLEWKSSGNVFNTLSLPWIYAVFYCLLLQSERSVEERKKSWNTALFIF
jgi:hypothetical protein